MATDLSKVPGYARNIVLVGCPEDQAPSLHPHHTWKIAADLLSVMKHKEAIRTADLVVFYATEDLLRAPITEDEFAALGKFFHGSDLAKSFLSAHEGATDAMLGHALVTTQWDELRHWAVSILTSLLVDQSGGQMFGANVIVFLPYDLPDSDDSAWKQWLGLPYRDCPAKIFDRFHVDNHTISWLYYYRFMRWYCETAYPLTNGEEGTFAAREFKRGLNDLMPEIEAYVTLLGQMIPEYFDPPLIQESGGLASAAMKWLPEDAQLQIVDTPGDGTHKETPLPTISPVFQVKDMPCSSARLAFGIRNTFFMKQYQGSGAFIEDVVRYLYQFNISSIADQYEYAAPKQAQHARSYVESRMRYANPIVGESAGILQLYTKLFDTIESPQDPILIYGPIGAGKEVVFRAMQGLLPHDDMTRIIDVAGLEGSFVQSTLFGHEKGAFTGASTLRKGAVEEVGSGTLVIDNFQNVSIEIQAKLLRLLETKGEYQRFGDDKILISKARIVIALNIDPKLLIRRKRLLPDLLSRFPIYMSIPPLNERRVDIPLLVDAFERDILQSKGWDKDFGDLQSVRHLVAPWIGRDWSESAGNVRGLRNEVQQSIRNLRRSLLLYRASYQAEHGDQSTDAHAEELHASLVLKNPRGRKPGPKVADELIIKYILAFTDSGEFRHVSWIFAQIDKHLPTGHGMRRSKGALRERVRRIKDQKLRIECFGRIEKVPGYRELPYRVRSRPKAGRNSSASTQ